MHRDLQTARRAPRVLRTRFGASGAFPSICAPRALLDRVGVSPTLRAPFGASRRVPYAALFAALLAAAALSCATIGHRFPPENVALIRNGETTKSQLLGQFGLPYRRGIEDGDSTWTYVYYKFRLFGENLRTRDLYLRFGPDGVVRSYTYNSNLDD